MKANRRNFLKLLGSTGLAAPLKKLQPAIDRTRIAIAKRVIKILLPANGVYVPQITGVPMIDFFLSMDYPQQIMPCGCLCTPEGDLIEGCEEEKRLRGSITIARQPIYQAAHSNLTITWKDLYSFLDATKSYIRHFRATVVREGESTGMYHPLTGEEIRL